MKNSILVVAISIGLSACSGESNMETDPVTDTSASVLPDIGAAKAATNQTTLTETTQSSTVVDETLTLDTVNSESLNVSNNFSFDTARTVEVEFDLEQARNQLASISICTSFDPSGGVYSVDYDSCTVQGQMLNGTFHHAMQVTNDIESVAAVVWFQDSSMQPLMQVFSVAHDTSQSNKERSLMSANRVPKIIWR